jgi:hypothetical protein
MRQWDMLCSPLGLGSKSDITGMAQLAIVRIYYRPVLSPGRAPQNKKTANVFKIFHGSKRKTGPG